MIAIIIMPKQLIMGNQAEGIKRVLWAGLLLNFPFTLVVALACFFFPDWIMKIFIANSEIIAIGAEYLRIVSWGYLLFALLYACNGIINGAGKGGITLIFSIASLVLVRVPLAAVSIPLEQIKRVTKLR